MVRLSGQRHSALRSAVAVGCPDGSAARISVLIDSRVFSSAGQAVHSVEWLATALDGSDLTVATRLEVAEHEVTLCVDDELTGECTTLTLEEEEQQEEEKEEEEEAAEEREQSGLKQVMIANASILRLDGEWREAVSGPCCITTARIRSHSCCAGGRAARERRTE